MHDAGKRTTVQLGQRVSTNLYGRGMGTVVGIHGEQAPATVRSLMGGLVAMGGRASFDIVFDGGQMTHRLPESILHGVQWQIHPEVVDANAVRAAVARAQQYQDAAQQAKAQKEAEHAAAVAALRDSPQFRHLKPACDRYDTAGAVKNVRAHLKHTFPGVRFSVRKDATSVTVRWMDGPTDAAVTEALAPFRAGRFDSMTDCYTNERTPFGDVFGSVKYVSTSRTQSDALVSFAIATAFDTFAIDGAERPTPEAFRRGECYTVPLATPYPRAHDLQSLLHAIIARTSGDERTGFTFAPEAGA